VEKEVTMAWDITLELENRPGRLAALGEAAGQKGINIEGICGFPCGDVAELHILVEDVATASDAFAVAGFEPTHEREVLVIDIEDRPGELGRLAGRLADAGINIDLLYLATNTRAVVGVDDVQAGRDVLQEGGRS
jgi:hypothetical protein